MFKKTIRLKFFNSIDGVEKTMPIITADQVSVGWKKDAAREFNHDRQHKQGQIIRNIVNCTGINTLNRQGWVIRAWQDFYIKPEGTTGFSWRSPIDQKELNGEDYIDYHGPDRLKYFKNWPTNTLKCLVKVNTGWRVEVPKGYVLYQLPLFYHDENRFTACAGTYTKDIGLAWLNVPLYWHATNREETVKCGTPLCQLVLAPLMDYEFEILDKPDTKKEKLFRIMTDNGFVRDYKRIKNFFKN